MRQTSSLRLFILIMICFFPFLTTGGEVSHSEVVCRSVLSMLVNPVPDEDFFKFLQMRKPELVLLAENAKYRDGQPTQKAISTQSPSEILFGKKYAQYDRTVVSLLALKWVLENEWEMFVSGQRQDQMLSRKNFDLLKDYTRSFVSDESRASLLVTYLILNDLKKDPSESAPHEEDGDAPSRYDYENRLSEFLKSLPAESLSIEYLVNRKPEAIFRALDTQFSLTQFVYGENIPESLEPLDQLEPEVLTLHLLQAFFDVAGADGQISSKGALAMTDPVFRNFWQAIQSLEKYFGKDADKSVSAKQRSISAYWDYIDSRSKALGFGGDLPQNERRALMRLGLMFQITTLDDVNALQEVIKALPKNIQDILINDLGPAGLENGQIAFKFHSASRLMRDLKKSLSGYYTKSKDYEIGAITIARSLQMARNQSKNKQPTDSITIDLTKARSVTPYELLDGDMTYYTTSGNDVRVYFDEREVGDSGVFPRLELSNLPGNFITFVRGDGGSIVQAAQFGKLVKNFGRGELKSLISIRSLNAENREKYDEFVKRHPNHFNFIAPGVYKILGDRVSFQVIESNLKDVFFSDSLFDFFINKEVPVYQIIDEPGVELENRFKKVTDLKYSVAELNHSWILFINSYAERLKINSEGDLRVLNGLSRLGADSVYSAFIAAGFDSKSKPQMEMQRKLQHANASYIELNRVHADEILRFNQQSGFDGADPRCFDRVGCIWQQALRDLIGLQVLPDDPQDPFAYINRSMKGIYFMDLWSQINAFDVRPLTSKQKQILVRLSGSDNVNISKLLMSEDFKSAGITLDELYSRLRARRNINRTYTVVYSGHGSHYRFDRETPELSPKFTLSEARIAQYEWEGYADTIGGRAEVVHVPSWKGDRSHLPFIMDHYFVPESK